MTSPQDPQSDRYLHINGGPNDLLDRLAVSELCKGWPVYRDASEWKNFRALFCEDAFVWTTWSKRQSIDGFIQKSKDGKSQGDFIMHRECGTAVDLNPSTGRAVGKMKATITQRFKIENPQLSGIAEPVVFDVDCDCRFHFFCFQEPGIDGGSDGGPWRVKYVKLIYEKDKIVPADGKTAPTFTSDVLEQFPEGYRYLGAAQSMLGHDVDEFLPTIQGSERGSAHRLWLDLYEKMEQWLKGEPDVDLTSVPASVLSAKGSNGAPTNGKAYRNGNGNGHAKDLH